MSAPIGACGIKTASQNTSSEDAHLTTGAVNTVVFEFGNAICYSGYREGQSPIHQSYPSYDQIREDLLIIAKNWRYIRIYDSGPHAETTLSVIRDEKLELQVMLGAGLEAEASNPGCPWGGQYDSETLAANRRANQKEVERLIGLALAFKRQIFAVSVGNEASVDWTDHLVPTETLIDYVQQIKRHVAKPITFCENYVPWTQKLDSLAATLDFISIHTYPVWEYRSIHDALEYTKQNYYSVRDRYPEKPVVITEAGWTTSANGRGIDPHNASEELQAAYYGMLMEWTSAEKILTFVFEAFDEPWKGSSDPQEPEKHWGLFKVDRTPKLVMRDQYAELVSQ
ncbi:MAG: glycosyl hydrolase family 17 protein [Pseudomonadota bacterium]